MIINMSARERNIAPALKNNGYQTMLNIIIITNQNDPLYLQRPFPGFFVPNINPKQKPKSIYHIVHIAVKNQIFGMLPHSPQTLSINIGLPESNLTRIPAKSTMIIPAITVLPSVCILRQHFFSFLFKKIIQITP